MATMYVCGIPECSRPCFERGGIVHGYCGRTHAAEALSRGLLDHLSRPHGVCHRCQLHGCARTVHFEEDTGRVHDFCCRRHAQMAMQRGQWPRRGSTGSRLCQIPYCGKAVYRDPENGRESNFCSRSHYEQHKYMLGSPERPPSCMRRACSSDSWIGEDGVNHLYCSSRCAIADRRESMTTHERCSLPGCVQPSLLHYTWRNSLGYCSEDHKCRADSRSLVPRAEPFVDRTFRGGTTSSTDFKLSVLTNAHPDYPSVKKQFLEKWIKPEPVNGVTVRRIFNIQVPADVRQRFEEYKRSGHNARRRFHGTSCSAACTFFVDLRGGPCGESGCSVCSICTHGFQLSRSGRTAQATGVGLRFGNGLYFSSVSGKANDYAKYSEKVDDNGRRFRCMFLASVVVGRAFKTTAATLPNEQCPPPGYDSVVGEPGGGLNYDEVVVYNEGAAIPRHLIVYVLND